MDPFYAERNLMVSLHVEKVSIIPFSYRITESRHYYAVTRNDRKIGVIHISVSGYTIVMWPEIIEE